MELPVRRGLSCAIALCGLLAASAAAAQTVSGTVRSRLPLEGVAVRVELDGRALTTVVSDAGGKFSFQLRPGTRAASDLLLGFDKQGFKPEARLLRAEAAARPLDVVLLPLTGVGAIPDDVRQVLDRQRTTVGTGPLMFVPYAVPGNAPPASTNELNLRLHTQLQRLILTHVQAALDDADMRNLALSPLEVAAADHERMRTYGEYVNALAVIGGTAIGDGAQTVELSSSFVIIPRAAKFEPPVLMIVDRLPAASLGQHTLDQRMSREWGRATVIALAASQLRAAQSLDGEARRAALKRVQRYVVAERASVGGNETFSARKLKELFDQVKAELGE